MALAFCLKKISCAFAPLRLTHQARKIEARLGQYLFESTLTSATSCLTEQIRPHFLVGAVALLVTDTQKEADKLYFRVINTKPALVSNLRVHLWGVETEKLSLLADQLVLDEKPDAVRTDIVVQMIKPLNRGMTTALAVPTGLSWIFPAALSFTYKTPNGLASHALVPAHFWAEKHAQETQNLIASRPDQQMIQTLDSVHNPVKASP